MRQQALLIVSGEFAPGDRVPRDQELGRVGKLPDVPAAPVTDWLPRSKARELLEPPISHVCLADVDGRAARYPASTERLDRDRRVFALEVATSTRL